MGHYVRIESAQVVETIESENDMATMFHPALQWVDVTEHHPRPNAGWGARHTEEGWTFFSPVPPDPVSILEARIAARRYEVETAGVLIGDVALATDRTAQGQLANVAVAAFMDEGFRCRWKTRDGFVELSSSQILEVARAVQKHIEACFDREAELLDYLARGLYEEVMFDQGWPTSTLSQTASE